MGSVTINGATSGQITLQPTAVAGTNTITIPAATGTILTTAGGQSVNTSIGINGSSSGTITLAAPAAAGTNTITLAAQTGTLNAAGPAFHVESAGTQTFTTNTVTKVTLTTEVFDTNNNFASSTFTPTVAGYYQINGVFWFIAGTTATDANAYIYKNGAFYSQTRAAAYSNTQASCPISGIVYCNGTTDFIEFYGRASGTGTLTANANMFFSGCLIRGA